MDDQIKMDDAKLLAVRAAMRRTAGEVRFIKDKSGDASQWGWGTPGPSERTIQEEFEFKPKNIKPLALILRSALLSMGHALSAHAAFLRLKSAEISPDGSLGGKGYIQKIPDMRRQMMNVCEALSSFTDTIHDEIRAPHWTTKIEGQGKRERDDVSRILDDTDEIRADPEAFAEKEEAEMDEEAVGPSGKYARAKCAASDPMAARIAHAWLQALEG